MSRIEYSLPFDSRAFRRTHMDLDAHETVANFHRLLRSSTPSSTPKRGAKIFLARRGCWVELEGKRDGFFLKTPKRKKSLRINTLPLKKKKKNSSLLKLLLNTVRRFPTRLFVNTHALKP